MTKASFALICIFTTSLLPGCSHIESKRFDPKKEIPSGITYSLPATQLTITASVRLKECGSAPDFDVNSISYVSDIVPDKRDEYKFVIDTEKLTNYMKAIPKAEIKLKNNTIESIHYQANDKSGEVIGNVAKLVAISHGISIPKLKAAGEVCTPEMVNLLAELSEIDTKLSKIKTSRDNAVKRLEAGYLASTPDNDAYAKHVLELSKHYKESIDRIANTKDTDEIKKVLANTKELQTQFIAEASASTQRETNWVGAVNSQLSGLSEQTEKLSIDRAKVIAGLTTQIDAKWTPYPKDINHVTLSFDGVGLRKWFDDSAQPLVNTYLAKLDTSLNLQLFIATTCDKKYLPIPATSANALYYRVPEPCDITLALGKATAKLKDVPLLQYGYSAKIPISNGPFEENQFNVDFDETSAQLKRFQYISTDAAMNSATSSIVESYDLIKQSELEKLEGKKALLDAEKELYKSRLETLQAKDEYEKAKKAYEDALKASVGN